MRADSLLIYSWDITLVEIKKSEGVKHEQDCGNE
jgi:hypothetical protein